MQPVKWALFVLQWSAILNAVGGSESHLICKHVSDIFAREDGNEISEGVTGRYRGVPGKQGVPGAPGPRGLSGPVGPPGRPDRTELGIAAKKAMKPGLEALAIRIDTLSAKLEDLLQIVNNSALRTEETEHTGPKPVSGFCTIFNSDKCFWLEVSTTQNISRDEAQRLCAIKQGRMSGIYNQEQYDKIVESARKHLPASRPEYYFLWLGMKVQPATKLVTQPDGSRSQFLPWSSGNPDYDSTYTFIKLRVYRGPGSHSHEGIYTISNTNSFGVVCETSV